MIKKTIFHVSKIMGVVLITIFPSLSMENERTDKTENKIAIDQPFHWIPDRVPTDVLSTIFYFLPKSQLNVKLVSQEWLQAAEYKETDHLPFGSFYSFQTTFHNCLIELDKTFTCQTAWKIYTDLREAHKTLSQSGWSMEEQKKIAEIFLKRNFSITQEKASRGSLWGRLAMLRLYNNCFTIGDVSLKKYIPTDTISIEFEPQDIVVKSLKILDDTDALKEYFKNEMDLEAKCAYATELCERNDQFIAVVLLEAENKALVKQDYKEAAELYCISLKKGYERNLDINIRSYLNAIWVCLKLGKYAEAAAFYTTAFKRDPNLEAIHYANAGFSCLNLKKFTEAEAFYTAAFTKDPNMEARHYVNAGSACVYLKKYAEAAAFYTTAFKKDPNMEAIHYAQAGFSCLSLEKDEKAAAFYTAALTKDPNLEAHHYVNAGYACLNLEKHAEAETFYTIGLTKDPNLRAHHYVNAGYACLNLEKYKKSIIFFRTAFEKDPTLEARNYLNIGYCYAKLNDYNSASFYFQEFIKKCPEGGLSYRSDTLNIIQSALIYTNAEEKFLQWVQTEKGKGA